MSLKTKGLSDEIINPPTAPGNSLGLSFEMNLSLKSAVEFKGSCLKQDKTSFIHSNEVNLFILYELDIWSTDLSARNTLSGCGFGAVKLTKNTEPNKFGYSGYGNGFDTRSKF